MAVKDLRRKLGLPDLDEKEVRRYRRQRRKQNEARAGFGMPPLPLVLAELKQCWSDDRVSAFMEQFAPRTDCHRDTLSFSGCISYDTAISAGCGDDERIGKPRPLANN